MDPRLNAAFQDARAGNARAFRALIEALAPDLVRFTTYLLQGDVDGAHDVVQDVFVLAWKHLRRLDGLDHLRRWCYRVARCQAVSWWRHHSGSGRTPVQLSALPSSVHVAPLRAEAPARPDVVRERASTFEALRVALRRLPLRYGAPVQLHYLQGYSLRETARLLGTSASSVKMRLVRARLQLRSSMAGMLEPHTTWEPAAEASAPGRLDVRGGPRVREGGPHAP